jgi:agmatinase
VRYGHGNPLRRASEMNHITGMTQMRIRNVSSSNCSDYDAARAAGSNILSVRDVRRLDRQGVVDQIPDAESNYITIDIDGFDPLSRLVPVHLAMVGFNIMKYLKLFKRLPCAMAVI